MTIPYEELVPLVEELKATLRKVDVAGQGAALGHALGGWLCVYAGASPEAREKALKLLGDMALKLADLYGDAAEDGVEAA